MGKFMTAFRENTAHGVIRHGQKGKKKGTGKGSGKHQHDEAPDWTQGRRQKGKGKGAKGGFVQPMGKKKGKGKGAIQREVWVQPIASKPRRAKGSGKGEKGKGKGKVQQSSSQVQYQKIKHTSIRTVAGGAVVRVCSDGKQYAPNDVSGAQAHLAKIGIVSTPQATKGKGKGKGKAQGKGQQVKGKGKGKAQGKGQKVKGKGKGKESAGANKKVMKKLKISKMQKKPEKTLTPEQKEERDQKRAERNAAIIEEEGRVIVGASRFPGEVVSRSKFCAWIKPSNPGAFPQEVNAKLKTMNEEIKAKAKENNREPFGMNVLYVRLADVEEGFQLKAGVKCNFKLYTDSKGVGGCDVVSA